MEDILYHQIPPANRISTTNKAARHRTSLQISQRNANASRFDNGDTASWLTPMLLLQFSY